MRNSSVSKTENIVRFAAQANWKHPERQSNKAALFSLTLCVCVCLVNQLTLVVTVVVFRHHYGLSETQRGTTLSLSVATQTSVGTERTFPGPLSASAHGPPLHATSTRRSFDQFCIYLSPARRPSNRATTSDVWVYF